MSTRLDDKVRQRSFNTSVQVLGLVFITGAATLIASADHRQKQKYISEGLVIAGARM
jgi:hypothetical protein